jgi:hypothetical protein
MSENDVTLYKEIGTRLNDIYRTYTTITNKATKNTIINRNRSKKKEAKHA